MPSAGFELVIPTGERLQTDALDRSATGIGVSEYWKNQLGVWERKILRRIFGAVKEHGK
jgi:hypothetical protein